MGTLQRLSVDEASAWFDELPENQQIATLSPDYVVADAQRDNGLSPYFYGYREHHKFWLHGVHRSPITGMDFFDHQSPYGYGGPVCNDDSADFLGRAWSAYVEACHDERILAEFIRLHPMGPDSCAYLGTVSVDRQAVFLDLTVADLRASYSTRCRTAIRKALNHEIETVWPEQTATSAPFGSYYRDGMKAISAHDFYFFNDAYFEALQALPDAELLICHRHGEWLSAGLFLTSGRMMEYHLSATTTEGRHCGATNLLIDAAAHRAQARGCTSLYLGGGTDAHIDNPLLFFKQSFSKLKRPFRIGFTTFWPDHYQALKRDYMQRADFNSRYLFYRN
jgi:hypothetical protein